MEEEADQFHRTLKLYVDEFRQNQESFKAHLKGISSNEPPLLPAFLPPSSYWTSAEKDLFFHALSTCSRLQPELIAQHVKTKNIFDVCVYLEVLKTAAELTEEEEEEEEENGGGTEGSVRPDMEPAMDVSEKWILREEAIAESLVALDACPCGLEAPKSKVENCTCPSITEGNSVDQPLLNHLDPTCLTVLEKILKEGTEEDAQSMSEERQRSTSVLDPQTSIPPGDSTQISVSTSGNPLSTPDRAQLRLIQKRLYMRRKRAEAVGKAASMEVTKIRPGRHARVRKPPKPRPKTYKPRKARTPGRGRKCLHQTHVSHNSGEDDNLAVDEQGRSSAPPRQSPANEQGDSEDSDSDSGSAYERRAKGGTTKPYRLKKLFRGSGVTSQTLSELDLDFFNLTALGKLLRKRDAVSTSVECIQLLREMVKAFSSKVIQRAIIMKEQEIRLKANLKVWKYDREEISVENMLDCLKAMELDQLSRERYFSDVFVDDDDDDDESSGVPVDEEWSDEQPLGSEETSESMRPESLFPFPAPPSYLSNLTYCDLFSEGDDVLSSDVEEAALTKELAEEDILDVLDIMRSKEYEKNLWKTHC